MERRTFVHAVGALPLMAAVQSVRRPPSMPTRTRVATAALEGWSTSSSAGFAVQVTTTDNMMAVRKRMGIPDVRFMPHRDRWGVRDGGHVPVPEIRRLPALKPRAIGPAVPSMPVGSPGRFFVDLEDRSFELGPQQGVTVPKGIIHRTRAPERAVILMMETARIVPTGDDWTVITVALPENRWRGFGTERQPTLTATATKTSQWCLMQGHGRTETRPVP